MSASNQTRSQPEHLNLIKALAAETDHPVDEVKSAYLEILESLGSDARIKDYLIVLTCKKVRDELRK